MVVQNAHFWRPSNSGHITLQPLCQCAEKTGDSDVDRYNAESPRFLHCTVSGLGKRKAQCRQAAVAKARPLQRREGVKEHFEISAQPL